MRVGLSYRDLGGNAQTEESEGLRAVCHSTVGWMERSDVHQLLFVNG